MSYIQFVNLLQKNPRLITSDELHAMYKRCEKFRFLNGISIQDIAAATGLTRQWVSKCFKNKTFFQYNIFAYFNRIPNFEREEYNQ